MRAFDGCTLLTEESFGVEVEENLSQKVQQMESIVPCNTLLRGLGTDENISTGSLFLLSDSKDKAQT